MVLNRRFLLLTIVLILILPAFLWLSMRFETPMVVKQRLPSPDFRYELVEKKESGGLGKGRTLIELIGATGTLTILDTSWGYSPILSWSADARFCLDQNCVNVDHVVSVAQAGANPGWLPLDSAGPYGE